MSTNVKSFNRAIRKFTKDLTAEELWAFKRLLVLDIFKRIVLKTPVDTGRAQGNWQIANSTNEEIKDSTTPPTADLAVFNDPLQTIYIFNNMPYIIALEEGSSRQSPSGMVKVTLQEIEVGFARQS